MALIPLVVVHVILAVPLMKLAKKASMSSEAWWAWIPVLNAILFLKLAGKPAWWFVLLLIPLVNIVVGIMAWMGLAERFGSSAVVGLIMGLLAPIGLIWLFVLAFGSAAYKPVAAAAVPPSPGPTPPMSPPSQPAA